MMTATGSHYTGFVPLTAAEAAVGRATVEADLGERYRIDDYVARGGFATVWAATDTTDNSPVAVKRIEPRVARGRDFYRELKALVVLNHPHVVRLINFLDAPGARYLIMEHCRGGTLRAAVSRRRRENRTWDVPDVNAMIRAVASGLAAAHAAGLTHRDLKPENVLFTADGTAKLADFGLSGLFRDPEHALRSLTGSPAYMAPEQFSGSYSPASDVYALGVMACELLTGDLPFHGSPEQLAMQHLREVPPLASLPAGWAAMIARMMAKVPHARPTAADVVEWLDRRPRVVTPDTAIEVVLNGAITNLVALGDGFAALMADGVTLIDPTGHADRVVITSPLRVGVDHTQALWVQTTTSIDAAGVTMQREPGVEVWHVDADGRLETQRDTLRRVGPNGIVWSVTVPGGGLQRRIAVAMDGTIAITDIDGSPGLQIRQPDGTLVERIVLPGIASQVFAWSNEARFALRLLCGEGYAAFSTRKRGGLGRLPDGDGVATLAAGPAGIMGLRADGEVIAWDANRRPLTFTVAGRPKWTALASRHVAVARVDGTRTCVSIIPWPVR